MQLNVEQALTGHPFSKARLLNALDISGRYLFHLVLSSDRQQQGRVARTLLAATIFAYSSGWTQYAIGLGIIEPGPGNVLSIGMLVTGFSFYFILRSGVNLRFADPALTVPQILTALSWICGAYAISNTAHGGLLILYSLAMTFGIFNTSWRSALACSGYAIVCMGATMYFKSSTDPLRYPPRVELLYFSFVLIIMPTIGQLSAQITSMRERVRAQKVELQSQKLELEQAMERIRELATRDALTGLINRREMIEVAQRYASLKKREAVGFSVVMIDLDHFKQINDTWGHGVGDEILRCFAREARSILRETDTISRWGGEEFLVLLHERSLSSPSVAIERLRQHLSQLSVRRDIPELRISFSAGLVSYRGDETLDEAIDRADKALYKAKTGGRGRTVSA